MARIGWRTDRRGRQGFTLVELAVVVVVLALLAAILVPSFLGQRDKAGDAAAKSLVRNGAITIEALYAESGSYAGLDAADAAAAEPNINWVDGPGAQARRNEVSIEGQTATTYTLSSRSDAGRVFRLIVDRAAGTTVRDCGGGCTW